jgi:hypothetical protein
MKNEITDNISKALASDADMQASDGFQVFEDHIRLYMEAGQVYVRVNFDLIKKIAEIINTQ